MNHKYIPEEPKARIRELLGEIVGVYNSQMRRKVEGGCDICGKGDSNERFRLKGVVTGFEKRPKQSPKLCYNHFCGWNLSYLSRNRDVVWEKCPEEEQWKIPRVGYQEEIDTKYGMSDEEVDLHFAFYLAKQLAKEARKEKIAEEI